MGNEDIGRMDILVKHMPKLINLKPDILFWEVVKGRKEVMKYLKRKNVLIPLNSIVRRTEKNRESIDVGMVDIILSDRLDISGNVFSSIIGSGDLELVKHLQKKDKIYR